MSTEHFFDETTEQSKVKALIVSKYFWAWASIIIATAQKNPGMDPRIAYIDLFAGPGRYKDGTKSTPMMILEAAINDEEMKERLVTIFNDKDPDNCNNLKDTISALPNINALKYQPKIWNNEVDQNFVEGLNKYKIIPTLFFIDPWGYKGLSLELISTVLKDWGCDCIFFFNFNRINMGLGNEKVKPHMDSLFGEERANALRVKVEEIEPYKRELFILEELGNALKEKGMSYVLPFSFKNENGTRTSHHLVFVSKHRKGYEVMKEIMAKESSNSNQGVATFGYNPADIKTPMLFELSRPLDDLEEMLLNCFSGQTKTMQEIYLFHNIGKPYIKANYKSILKLLESKNRITVNPPASERPKRNGEVTFGDKVNVTFPKR